MSLFTLCMYVHFKMLRFLILQTAPFEFIHSFISFETILYYTTEFAILHILTVILTVDRMDDHHTKK